MTKRPRKIHNPAKRAAEDRKLAFEAIGLPGASSTLAQHQDVEITRAGHQRDGHKVDADSARRLDAFEALKDSMRNEPYTGCYDAARRMERDMTIALGEHDRGARVDRVDNGRAKDRTDAMIDASRRLEGLRNELSNRDWRLLNELMRPTIERDTWREVVRRVAGEHNANAQGATVRAACVNLRDAYERLDVVRHRAA